MQCRLIGERAVNHGSVRLNASAGLREVEQHFRRHSSCNADLVAIRSSHSLSASNQLVRVLFRSDWTSAAT